MYSPMTRVLLSSSECEGDKKDHLERKLHGAKGKADTRSSLEAALPLSKHSKLCTLGCFRSAGVCCCFGQGHQRRLLHLHKQNSVLMTEHSNGKFHRFGLLPVFVKSSVATHQVVAAWSDDLCAACLKCHMIDC